MSNEPKWRDDAAETYLAHPRWWMDGGFAGILFGAGNSDCVNYLNDSDNGWFVNKMTAASATPIALPTVGIANGRVRLDRPRRPALGPWEMRGRDLMGRLKALRLEAGSRPGLSGK